MRDLPGGTVTFLFTDIDGSTKLLHELGAEGYGSALADHRRLLRETFARHAGVEVDTQGDAFFIAFRDASAALRAAADAQRALATGPVRVRMGLHTGSPHLTAEGYVGHDVHLGARIAAAGHGGQVLVSSETRRAVSDELDLLDLGEHRVKDFPTPVWIYQLGTERFPPLKTISNSNLPRPASAFVGREREVGEITALLRDGARLVTLTGPGGTGKTRLSLEAAAELVPDFRNGTFWVDLVPIVDPELVVPTIAGTLGAKNELAEHIGERHMLLVLDNLEQVVAAAPRVGELVAKCPNLRVLATSRERLRVRDEVEYAVPPLALPDAVELFTTRAGLAANGTVNELCERLDRLPLAIELAAARTGVMSPAQILGRMAKRLDLLKGGRDAEARQQTLRATIEWSHDLLNEEEKTLFARLGVFRGGCSLEAAEQVAAADLDTLQSLVDKSLVRHSGERFWMLETIREYALERLDASAEADALRRRHADFFVALAAEAEPHLRGATPTAWLDRLGPENDNFRAALDDLHARRDGERALRLSASLDEFWCPRNKYAEGRRYLDAALRIDERPTPARARALIAAAHLARDDGAAADAEKLASAALALSGEIADEWAKARAVLWLGAAVADQGDFRRAQQLFEESARLFEQLHDDNYALFAKRLLAWMYYELGDRVRARTMHEANLVRARELGNRSIEASVLGALSEYAVDDGRLADAFVLSAAGIRLYLDLNDTHGVAIELCTSANTLVPAGHLETAVQLLASSDAWFEEIGSRPLPYLDQLIQRTLASARERLGEEAFASAWEEGRRLSLVNAAVVALEALERSTARDSGT